MRSKFPLTASLGARREAGLEDLDAVLRTPGALEEHLPLSTSRSLSASDLQQLPAASATPAASHYWHTPSWSSLGPATTGSLLGAVAGAGLGGPVGAALGSKVGLGIGLAVGVGGGAVLGGAVASGTGERASTAVSGFVAKLPQQAKAAASSVSTAASSAAAWRPPTPQWASSGRPPLVPSWLAKRE